MSATAVRLQIDRDFWLESFRDFLALESGHSANTVEAYLRDLRRMGEFATSRGIRDPARLTRVLLREFVFLLKDLGLSPSSIRRSVSAIRTYYGHHVAARVARASELRCVIGKPGAHAAVVTPLAMISGPIRSKRTDWSPEAPVPYSCPKALPEVLPGACRGMNICAECEPSVVNSAL